MSVRGEFVRLLGDTAEALRGGSAASGALADALLGARELASEDLAAAATRVLELWPDGSAAPLELPRDARERLDEAAERLLAVSCIILGR